VRFFAGAVGFEALAPWRAERLRRMPTRLASAPAGIEAAVAARRAAAVDHLALGRHLSEQQPRR
jgi:hypothetical protein